DSTTVLDTKAPVSSASSPAYSTSTAVTVTYTAADSGSGVDTVELWARVPGGSFAKAATDSTPAANGSFSYSAAAGDGSYAFYTVAVDKAGHREQPSADTATLLDTKAPSSSASSSPYSTSTSIAVSYTADDSGSGLERVELWAQAPGATDFAKVATDAAPGAKGSVGYTAGAGDGSYASYT